MQMTNKTKNAKKLKILGQARSATARETAMKNIAGPVIFVIKSYYAVPNFEGLGT